MDKLSREKAEQLINSDHVKKTSLEQNKKELRILMELSNGRTCMVIYNKSKRTKTYFIK